MADKASQNVQPDPDEYLNNHKQTVDEKATQMFQAMDSHDMEAIKYGALMLAELRTSLLSPQQYYALYMLTFEQLRQLESFFHESFKRGKKMNEMYELVQQAGFIVPRLYLMITVGSVYMRTQQAPSKFILKDLVEMCKGVQHPMRGLFLRYYLLQMCKDKLPDTSEECEEGTVHDSLEFILQNFTEMNRLWVRMQHQGHVSVLREKERMDLRVLVGENLNRISHLEHVTEDIYKETVLPQILEQVVSCNDRIAQQYLMEIIIQVFPDEFHLATLQTYLEALESLEPGVDVVSIIIAFLDRLARFGATNRDAIGDGVRLFEKFSESIERILERRGVGVMGVKQVIVIYEALLGLVARTFPDRLEFYDDVYRKTVLALERLSTVVDDTPCVKILKRMLLLPLEPPSKSDGAAAPRYSSNDPRQQALLTPPLDMQGLLSLEANASLLRFLHYTHRKAVALSVVHNILDHPTPLSDPDKVDRLFELIRPLAKDEPDMPSQEDQDEFEEQQNLVARLVHLLQHEDTDVQFRLLFNIRRHFGQGGTRRIKHTLVPLFFKSLHLTQRIYTQSQEEDAPARQIDLRKMMQFLTEIPAVLKPHYPEIALRMSLQAAAVADRCMQSESAYDFMTQAFVIYEEEISDSRLQFCYMQQIIGTLQSTLNFNEDSYDTLIKKATQCSSKLLKKPDQCRAICLCSHLFWADRTPENTYRDGHRVLECLKKTAEIADRCVSPAVHTPLFVEILNEYLYYFNKGNEEISAPSITSLAQIIASRVTSLDDETGTPVQAYHTNTIEHILWHQRVTPERTDSTTDEEMALKQAVRDRYNEIQM
eukprot:gnl/Trimastix_PCT/854.p1 GENE.gnl/Trimastix_PCT/854~~gnl/Trimastix_PCT/854.p1  ORF type:complete len:824 (+),score=310.59 gnl/Trimastix_PCT/854:56-2527(+)